MEEYDGNQKGVEEEYEEEGDEDDDVNVRVVHLHEVLPRKFAVCVICQRGLGLVGELSCTCKPTHHLIKMA